MTFFKEIEIREFSPLDILKIINFKGIQGKKPLELLEYQQFVNSISQKLYVLEEKEDPSEIVGYIIVYLKYFITYKDSKFKSKTQLESLIKLPDTKDMDISTWQLLINKALEWLRKNRSNYVFIIIKKDQLEYRKLVKKFQFRKVGFYHNYDYYMKKLLTGKLGLNYFPELRFYVEPAKKPNMFNVPPPKMKNWKYANFYSTMSKYFTMPNLITSLVKPFDPKKVLSIPSGSGEIIINTAIYHPEFESIIGVDRSSRSLNLTRFKLKYPMIDLINQLLCLYLGGNITGKIKDKVVLNLIIKILLHFKTPMEERESVNLFSQVKAYHEKFTSFIGTSDYLAPIRALARYVVKDFSEKKKIPVIQKLAKKIEINNLMNQLNDLDIFSWFKNEHEKRLKIKERYIKGNISLKQTDALNTGFDNDTFDFLIIFEAFIMFYGHGRGDQFLEEMIRITRPEGHILLVEIRQKDNVNDYPPAIRYAINIFKKNKLEIISQDRSDFLESPYCFIPKEYTLEPKRYPYSPWVIVQK